MTFKFIVDAAIIIIVTVLFTRWVFGILKILKYLEDQTKLLNNLFELQSIQVEHSIKQTELLAVMLSTALSNKKIALNHKENGEVIQIEPADLRNYSLKEYDIIIVDKQ